MDKREEIWQSLILSEKYFKDDNITEAQVYDAMDEYAKSMCLDLLEYMAKNKVECYMSEEGPLFLRKLNAGWEVLTKEKLFENFL